MCVCVGGGGGGGGRGGGGGERKKESPSKSLGGVCQPHRMWLPSGLKYM